MLLSVIVPVRDDAARLARCLKSVRDDAGTAAIEILVADNGSRDDSPQVAARAGARVLSLPDLRVSAIRNRAAQSASGDVLAFVDADHEVGPGWTAAAVDCLRESSVAAAGALYLSPPEGTWVQRMYGVLRGRTRGRRDTAWLGSGNMVVRRDAFERVGGFDESLEACEDVDLCRRLRAAGYRVVADEGLRSVHHGDPPTLGALFRAERWRGRDNIRVTLRGPVSLRDLPSVITPILGLISMAAVPAALALAAVSPGLAALVGIPGALLLPALASLRAAGMTGGMDRPSPVQVWRAFLVALVYDAARALALVTRAPHHRAGRS